MVKTGRNLTPVKHHLQDWMFSPAKNLMTIETGSRNTEDKIDDGGYPFFVRSHKVERINSYSYDCEAVLTAGDGVGTGKVFHYYVGKFDVHQRVYVMSHFQKILGKYFYYYFSANFLGEVSKYTAKSSVDSVRKNMIAEMLIPFPPINEQRKIAEALSDVDGLIESLEKLIAKKEVIKEGAMQELLTGRRRLPGFTGKWSRLSFMDVFTFLPNNSFTRSDMCGNGFVKNIHYGDILTKFDCTVDASAKDIPYLYPNLNISHIQEKCFLKSGDILFADTAEDSTVGKALEVCNICCEILAGQHTILCRPKQRFAPRFLGMCLNSKFYHNQLLPFIVGTKVSSISKLSLSSTRLIIPSYCEQQAIASVLYDMKMEIAVLEQKLEKCRQLKQGMMQQLLTGKIRLV